MSQTPPRIVEWYRVDETRRVAHAVVKGALLLMAGCFCIGAALSGVVSSDGVIRVLAGAFGGVCTICGPVITITGFQKILGEEIYVAFRTDGLFIHTSAHSELIAWDDVEDATPDEQGRIIIRRKDAGPTILTHRFGGLAPGELCGRIAMIRRKAQWNLLARPR